MPKPTECQTTKASQVKPLTFEEFSKQFDHNNLDLEIDRIIDQKELKVR